MPLHASSPKFSAISWICMYCNVFPTQNSLQKSLKISLLCKIGLEHETVITTTSLPTVLSRTLENDFGASFMWTSILVSVVAWWQISDNISCFEWAWCLCTKVATTNDLVIFFNISFYRNGNSSILFSSHRKKEIQFFGRMPLGVNFLLTPSPLFSRAMFLRPSDT